LKPKHPHLQTDEARFFGKNACIAICEHRPDDIIRVYIQEDLKTEFSDLLEWCAEENKAYNVVKEPDLERLSASVHHQGICIVAKRRKKLPFPRFLQELKQGDGTETLIFLDGVENPHNLGAIVRTASFLGIRYILGEKGRLPRLSPSAVRTAEGDD
jgi:TrmH RNA methyltransferase